MKLHSYTDSVLCKHGIASSVTLRLLIYRHTSHTNCVCACAFGVHMRVCVHGSMMIWCLAAGFFKNPDGNVQSRNKNHIVHTYRRKLVPICQGRKNRMVLIDLVTRCIIVFSQCVKKKRPPLLSLSLSLSLSLLSLSLIHAIHPVPKNDKKKYGESDEHSCPRSRAQTFGSVENTLVLDAKAIATLRHARNSKQLRLL